MYNEPSRTVTHLAQGRFLPLTWLFLAFLGRGLCGGELVFAVESCSREPRVSTECSHLCRWLIFQLLYRVQPLKQV